MKTIPHTVLGVLMAALIALPGARAQQSEDASRSAARNSATVKRPSDQDIANAKSEGLVWVNQSSRVYHRDGELYGRTKRGKFMSENDAKKAGFHEAKEPKSSGKSTGKKPGDQSGLDSTIGTHASTPANP